MVKKQQQQQQQKLAIKEIFKKVTKDMQIHKKGNLDGRLH